MFGSKDRGTVIAKGLKIVGTVTAEGLVEVNGQVDGELHCTSLIISRGAQVSGTIAAGRVVVDGNGRGPHSGGRCHFEIASPCRRRYSPPIAFDRERRLLRRALGACSRQWSTRNRADREKVGPADFWERAGRRARAHCGGKSGLSLTSRERWSG